MPTDEIGRIMQEIAVLRRQMGNMVRSATVHEVKGDKMRMNLGRDKEGQDVLGPWLHTGNHRGGARERRFFKKGQNLMLIAPGGDLAQASIMPYAPNKNFKSPEHANESGQDEETFQLDELRVKKTKKGYAIWLEEEQQQEEQQQQDEGGAGGGGGDDHQDGKPEKRKPKKPKPQSIINLSKDGGFTAKIGKDGDAMRVAVNKNGAKLKAGENFVTATKEKVSLKGTNVIIEGSSKLSLKSGGDLILDGTVFVKGNGAPLVDPPWQEGSKAGDSAEDGVADDDKVVDEDTEEQGGGEGGGGQ